MHPKIIFMLPGQTIDGQQCTKYEYVILDLNRAADDTSISASAAAEDNAVVLPYCYMLQYVSNTLVILLP